MSEILIAAVGLILALCAFGISSFNKSRKARRRIKGRLAQVR